MWYSLPLLSIVIQKLTQLHKKVTQFALSNIFCQYNVNNSVAWYTNTRNVLQYPAVKTVLFPILSVPVLKEWQCFNKSYIRYELRWCATARQCVCSTLLPLPAGLVGVPMFCFFSYARCSFHGDGTRGTTASTSALADCPQLGDKADERSENGIMSIR